jgi:malate dehydrogenase
VLVVGNPANTNALIASANAPDIDTRQFTAMTRLDHNRAMSQLAERTKVATTDISRLTIWGNHSATQYPDIHHAKASGRAAIDLVDNSWMVDQFIPTVQQRGAAIIKARGASSAASAACAAIDHMRTWVQGTGDDDWVSMAIPSCGHYGIEDGLIYSFPVRCADGEYSVVDDLTINEFSEERMRLTEAELQEERDGVRDLLR